MDKTSFIYRSGFIYEVVMAGLYGRKYLERLRAVADLIPNECSVLDLCCGPATLYRRHLRDREVRYTGLDINSKFVESLSEQGGTGISWDVAGNRPLPEADYVIMQASLYHFLPDPTPIVDRMLAAARTSVVIAEPIRNLADSKIRTLAWMARKMTNPGTGDRHNRFNESMLDRFFEPYQACGRIVASYRIAGNREKLYILHPDPQRSFNPAN